MKPERIRHLHWIRGAYKRQKKFKISLTWWTSAVGGVPLGPEDVVVIVEFEQLVADERLGREGRGLLSVMLLLLLVQIARVHDCLEASDSLLEAQLAVDQQTGHGQAQHAHQTQDPVGDQLARNSLLLQLLRLSGGRTDGPVLLGHRTTASSAPALATAAVGHCYGSRLSAQYREQILRFTFTGG